MKYEFDSMEELQEAMKNLSDYHDCEKCHGHIVFISRDKFGNSRCGYCNEIVKYPKMKREALKKWCEETLK